MFGVQASRGRESAGAVVAALHCGDELVGGIVLGSVCPLTPAPSPPFHGGEGRLWASRGR